MSDKYPHQFGICEFWEKYTRRLRNIRMFKSNVNHFCTILFYRIPIAKQYPERRVKLVTAMENGEKWLAQKIKNARIFARFATDKPSQFSKA